MTHPFTRTAAAALLIGVSLSGTPAAAGQISFTLAPNERPAAGALETGLRLYSLYNGLKDGSIRQEGRDNSAGLAQRGRANVGLVQQRGEGHSGTLEQNGDRNVYGLFQFGRGAQDAIVQSGEGRSGATFTYGW